MVVVGRAANGVGAQDALLELVRSTAPDVLVVGVSESDVTAQLLPLLAERPCMSVLGIDAAQGVAHVYKLRPNRIALGAVSPDEVATAIRRVARPIRLV
jgi:DNA-binding NarL/FixJ family response regulator